MGKSAERWVRGDGVHPGPSSYVAARTSPQREFLKARIGAALSLAIGNFSAKALQALAEVERSLDPSDYEMAARYFQARAIANIKARAINEGFKSFDASLRAARRHGESLMSAKILNNYAAAAMHEGQIDLAIRLAEEALEKFRAEGSAVPVGLVTCSEVLYAAGELAHAAELLREFHAIQRSDSTTGQAVEQEHRLSVAAIGIPVGIMLADAKLVKLNRDLTLLDLGFARNAQWLLGPLVEAFCLLYEHEGNREEHDALLTHAIDSISSLDHSLALAIRAARLGGAQQLPRLAMLMSRQCAAPSSLLHAHHDLFGSFVSTRRQMPERARELATRAACEFETSGRPLMYALALEAAGSLEKAQAIRRASGARVDGMRLKWSGTPIPKRLATNLTPREMEVARLVADGHTNREIATALALSERTVHRHCESIFGKLGIRSRWQVLAAISALPH